MSNDLHLSIFAYSKLAMWRDLETLNVKGGVKTYHWDCRRPAKRLQDGHGREFIQ